MFYVCNAFCENKNITFSFSKSKLGGQTRVPCPIKTLVIITEQERTVLRYNQNCKVVGAILKLGSDRFRGKLEKNAKK